MLLKSPIYRTGNKYKHLPKIINNLPEEINNFHDVFGGSGVVGINSSAKHIHYNEYDNKTFEIVQMIKKENLKLIDKYNDFKSKNYENDKQFFELTKNKYNESRELFYLWVCSFMSFSNDLRYNSNGEMNNTYGKRLSEEKLNEVLNFKNLNLNNKDFKEYLTNLELKEEDFVFLDPPYLQSSETNKSSYNNEWDIENEKKLLSFCEKLIENNIKFMITNTITNKGSINKQLVKFIKKHSLYVEKLTSYNNANGNFNTDYEEVIIMNYEPKYNQTKLF